MGGGGVGWGGVGGGGGGDSIRQNIGYNFLVAIPNGTMEGAIRGSE